LLQFIGVRVTPVGGAATVTLTAWLTPQALFAANAKTHPSAITIS
jgi:hypothetical protein